MLQCCNYKVASSSYFCPPALLTLRDSWTRKLFRSRLNFSLFYHCRVPVAFNLTSLLSWARILCTRDHTIYTILLLRQLYTVFVHCTFLPCLTRQGFMSPTLHCILSRSHSGDVSDFFLLDISEKLPAIQNYNLLFFLHFQQAPSNTKLSLSELTFPLVFSLECKTAQTSKY